MLTIATNEEVEISGPNHERQLLKPGGTRTLVTDKKGNLRLTLTCKDINHSPELKVRANIMATNKWFHVCPVIQDQSLVVLPPPKLTAQSDMIEDLRFSAGDTLGSHQPGDSDSPGKFHEEAKCTTIKTTITATGSNGSPRPFEPLEI